MLTHFLCKTRNICLRRKSVVGRLIEAILQVCEQLRVLGHVIARCASKPSQEKAGIPRSIARLTSNVANDYSVLPNPDVVSVRRWMRFCFWIEFEMRCLRKAFPGFTDRADGDFAFDAVKIPQLPGYPPGVLRVLRCCIRQHASAFVRFPFGRIDLSSFRQGASEEHDHDRRDRREN